MKAMTNGGKLKVLFNSMRTTLRVSANFLYLVMLIILTVFFFLNTTQFDLSWVNALESGEEWEQIVYAVLTSPQIILAVIVLVQYLCSTHFDWKEYVLAALICVLVFQIPERNGRDELVAYILLALGARNFSFRRLMQLYFAVALGMLVVTVAGSQLGWVENLVYTARDGRIAFGFIYPTDAAAHFLFLVLCYWSLRAERICYPEAAVFFVLGMIACFECKARFSTILLLLSVLSVCICRFLMKKKGEDRWSEMMSGVPSAFLVTMPLLCNLVIHILSMAYSESSTVMKALDTVVNSRLILAKRGIDIYGFNLFGHNIPMIGNGGETEQRLQYYYIDSSYMQLSLLYGVVIMGVILLLLTMAAMKARKTENWALLMVLSVVALHGIFEHHAFDLAYGPFLFAAFSDLRVPSGTPRKNISILRKKKRDEE